MRFQALINSPRRKFVTLSLCAVLGFFVIVASYYYLAIYNSYHVADVHGSYLGVKNLEELERTADVILIGSSNEKEGETITTKYPDGNIQDIYTVTNFNVDKIVKKPNELNISNTFKFNQPGGTVQTINGKVKIRIEEYDNIKSKTKYIIFLAKNDVGGYSLMYSNNGRFALDDVDNQAESQTQSNTIKDEVLRKYKK